MGSSVVAELAALSQSAVSVDEFQHRFLDCLRKAADAGGIWWWRIRAKDSAELLGAVDGHDDELAGRMELRRQRCLAAAEPGPATADDSPGVRISGRGGDLLYLPVRSDGHVYAVLEFLAKPHGAQPDRDVERFLIVACELAAGFLSHHELRQLRSEAMWTRQRDAFVTAVHGSLNLDETGYCIANDGRRLFDCDRLSVAVNTGRKCRIIAVSGQDRVHRRANAVRALERLADQFLLFREPILYPSTTDLPPALVRQLDAFLETSLATSVAVVPLVPPPRAVQSDESVGSAAVDNLVGLLIAESYRNVLGQAFLGRAAPLAVPCAIALDKAWRQYCIFLLPLWTALGSTWALLTLRTLPKVLAAVLLLVALAVGMLTIHGDFELAAEGTLEPEIRQHVFAPADGVVDEVRVREGSSVTAGEPLASLRNSELDFRLEQLTGEIQTTTKKLLAVKAARLAMAPQTPVEQSHYYQLAAEEEELAQWQLSLETQRGLRQRQKAELSVVSPIDGAIVTWHVEQLLTARPVGQGQTLMTVARLDGPWVLELLLPDRHVGNFLAVLQHPQAEKPSVSFILATEPQRIYRGRVQAVAEAMTWDEQRGQSLRVTVAVNRTELQVHQPGAAVVGKIYCGRKSLAYIWLHEIGDFFQSRVLFRWGIHTHG